MAHAPSTATVLLIEDERRLAELYTDYLTDEHDVVTAFGAAEGLERLDADVDVVLVDRQLPVNSGNEVVAEMEETPYDPQIALLTDANPDFDIIDLGVDDYLVKPVTETDLRETVDRLVVLRAYTDTLRELTGKKVTRNVLELEKPPGSLMGDERFEGLEADIEDLEERLAVLSAQLDLENEDLLL